MATRPLNSPYASTPVKLLFASDFTLTVPRDILFKNDNFVSVYLEGLSNSSFKERLEKNSELHLSWIPREVGHVLVHFLFTNEYQCLRPKGETRDERLSAEIGTALRVAHVAELYALPALEALADREIRRMGEELSLPLLVSILEDAADEKFYSQAALKYLASELEFFCNRTEMFDTSKLLQDIGTPTTVGSTILKSVISFLDKKNHSSAKNSRRDSLTALTGGLETDKEQLAEGKAARKAAAKDVATNGTAQSPRTL